MIFNYLLPLCGLAGTSATAADSSAAKGSPYFTIAMMVGLFAVMYFVMIRPQRKRQKEEQNMRDSIQIGDEITTIGGIYGRVVTVKDDSLVIETGSDRVKMKITRWAIQTNNTAQERVDKEKEALKKAQEAEKEARKNGEGRKSRKERKQKDDSDE
ncbi:MAG: preprotein translocase subunit YajC [Clostridia bacterium]|nr:preprotein translocase subunit YajC [Clostridia bacterium]MBR5427113.1 preprotein translocase subunit YajC [Clostridia bacterium]